MPINTNAMTDEGTSVARRVTKSTATPMSTAEAEAASMAAGQELGLTDAELQAGITDASQLTKLPGETNTQFNARVTQAYKDLANQPELTDAEKAGGATVQWVRTGAGGAGEYRTVYPIGGLTGSSTGGLTGSSSGFSGSIGAGAGAGSGASDGVAAAADLVAKQNQDALAAAGKAERQSAFDLLYNEFNKYGLGSMVDQIKGLITDSNVNPSQFSLALQNTDAYKQRFSANQDRIKQGLRALTPAEYIGLEDQYQNVMRNYGLPASYYTKDSTGKQSGFDKFLAGDVSASELEDRIATAQQRVVNSNPEVLRALKQFYPDINNADILAYTLDPKNALDTIHRKVTAAEIGGAALAQGLQAQGGTAESLAGLGVTKAQAQQGYTNVAEMVPRGSQLSDIYNQGPYNQQTAEAEVFNTAGAATAAAKRKKLTALETASFSGSSGVGSLNRDRAVSNYMLGQPGAGSY